ncbi:Two-component system sensor histidine kinase/response regulator hybrid [hydrothermal vent metagenome]|uniref:histidine kinase n=1 Tax=hydrothermal vent metagenome TaxID=652676 RepID=A0A3B0WQ17_9ZZZZ
MNKDALLIRREYNKWVANETLEDYALRYTAKQARRWSAGSVANTALGIVSFLALEAIGGAITLNYGFTNAMWAILVVGGIIFLSGLPLSYYAARYGVDIDLLTRGAGFGYIGSTVSSLIYASFTFIFFALEAAIMSMAIHMMVDIPLSLAYVISAVVIIPLVTHGISRISRFQAWTQPLWLVLQVLPLVFIGVYESTAFASWMAFPGVNAGGGPAAVQHFDLLLFGAAAAVIFPLIAQNGEQADFLRFLPTGDQCKKSQWWMAVVGAGPGWVVFGIVKLFIGSFLTVLALRHGLPAELASDPAHMYTVAFSYIASNPDMALWLAGIFVIISQLKINVTNAYAGSIAWGNFFSRLTHSHPGRVVWLVFNVAIALMLMELGLYQAFETILITYAILVVAWIGCVVADLVINKPLGLSPPYIEFRRGHLYDINPVGVVSMIIASCAGIAANLGVFGDVAEALAAFLSLFIPFVTVPLTGWLTNGRFYLARPQEPISPGEAQQQCRICENAFDHEDMSHCPSYSGPICSLCCALDSRCADQCRPDAHLAAQTSAVFSRVLPAFINQHLHSVTGHFLVIFIFTASIMAGLLSMVFYAQKDKSLLDLSLISGTLWQVFFLFLLLTGVLIWLYVLAQKSMRFALNEIQLQADLLAQEVNAHKVTAVELSHARDAANAANLAKSRYLSGVSHELRTPLNTIFGYAQLMETDFLNAVKNQKVAGVIRRSSEHLSDVIEGLLEISKIEARKLNLQRDIVDLRVLVQQLDDMFRPQAERKGIDFIMNCRAEIPPFISTDEKRLRQILLNLLSNAIKFTSEGRVELYISYRNQVASIHVKDTGTGIEKQDQQRIFEPFERVRNHQTQQVSGTGLGLSISRLLVEMMGGNLELVSQPGSGSEFCLRLFLPATDEAPVISHNQSDIQGYIGRSRQIMVVDDEKSHRNLMYDFLHPLGFVIHQAESAERALVMLKKQPIDLFLLDISMPGMNGWQLLEELRARGFNMPVIMLSADSYIDAHLSQKNADFQAYISKPVHLNKLSGQLQRCLDLHWTAPVVSESGKGAEKDVNRKPSGGDISMENTRIDEIALNIKIITSLKEFAKIGYLKGVLECTEQLELKTPQAQWVKQLRILVDKCDLNAIVRMVDRQLKL